MRCPVCGWVLQEGRCPCGISEPGEIPALVPVGQRVLARAGKGPSLGRWDRGEVEAHVGAIHRVGTSFGIYWCEADDLLVHSARRADLLIQGSRVWALWLDSRWYPGTIAGLEGPLRKVAFDDGDRMWMEARNLVVLAVEPSVPEVGKMVLAPRWDGRSEPANVEQAEGGRYRVTFQDGEEAWCAGDDLKTSPPNPFLEPSG